MNPIFAQHKTPEQVVQGNLDAYNARNLERFILDFADEIELYDFDGTLLSKGIVEMRKRYSELFVLSPNLHSKILNRIVFDNKVIDYEYITGRKGSTEPFEIVMIYEVKNDKIIKMTFIKKD